MPHAVMKQLVLSILLVFAATLQVSAQSKPAASEGFSGEVKWVVPHGTSTKWFDSGTYEIYLATGKDGRERGDLLAKGKIKYAWNKVLHGLLGNYDGTAALPTEKALILVLDMQAAFDGRPNKKIVEEVVIKLPRTSPSPMVLPAQRFLVNKY